jgi:hypothetical protein
MTMLKNARNERNTPLRQLVRGMSTEQEDNILMRMMGMEKRKPKREPKPVTIRHFSWES